MRPTFRSALTSETPLVTPLAHDALSARLIERAGFKAFAIGGSAMLASRFGLPDLGLIGLSDMVAGIREIGEVTELPFLADGDDGYGDVKSVVRMIHAYERLGVGGLLIEDQDRDVKQQRAERALRVTDENVILDKLRVAIDCRTNPDTFIIGRTDAYGALGLDAALRRAERFLSTGVDGLFVAGLQTEADYERVGRTFKGANLSAAMFEGGRTPWILPSTLGEMGFRHVSLPASLILRVVDTVTTALDELRTHALGTRPITSFPKAERARQLLDEALNAREWTAIASGLADNNK